MNAESIHYVLEGLGAPKIKNLGRNVQASCPLAPWNHASGHDESMKLGVKVQDGVSPVNCFYPDCFHGTLMGLVDAVSAKKVAAGEWQLGGEEASNLKAFIMMAEEDDEVSVERTRSEAPPIPGDVLALLGTGSDYWRGRGVDDATQGRFQMGEGFGRAFIPLISSKGQVIAMKGRLLPGLTKDTHPDRTFSADAKYRVWPPNADTSKYLLGEHLVPKPVDFLVIVESEVDAAVLTSWFQDPEFQHAFPYGTATAGAAALATGGGKFSEAQVQKVIDAVCINGEVAVAYDGDHAGRLAQRQMVEALRRRVGRVSEVEWEGKDPTDAEDGKYTLEQVKARALRALQARTDWFLKRVKNSLTKPPYR